MSELKNKIEALLFASGKGITLEDIADFCEEKKAPVKRVLVGLEKEFAEREGSLIVVEHNLKWKLTVRGKYTDHIRKIVSETELPGPILKTLAVVAYKSPVLQSEVIHMRGQSAYEHVKQLVKQKLITKDEEGRSYILKITDKFFNYFDVEGDGEIRDIFAALKAKEEERRSTAEEEHQKQIQQKLNGMEIVDSTTEKDHETIFDGSSMEPIRKQKTTEELEEEKKFLSNMDSKIDEISQRLNTHKLPQRHTDETDEKEESKSENSEEEEEENYL